MARSSSVHTFTGVIDGDSDPRLVAKGNYIHAENLFDSSRNVPGSQSNELGSSQVAYGPPGGVNTSIGKAEDSQNRTLVSFLRNSLGEHRILRWYADTNVITEVAIGGYLAFDNRIHHAHVLDGRYLVWTDGRSEGGDIVGLEPRKLDMQKSVVEGKKLSYELYGGIPGNGQFEAGDTISFVVRNLAGTSTVATLNITIPDDTNLGDPAAGFDYIANQIDVSGFDTRVDVEVCDCKLKISLKVEGQRLDFVTSNPQLILVPDNHYVPILSQMKPYHISLLKEPLDCAPRAEYVGVANVEYNNVRDGCFQFRTRVVYDNGELSSWSAVSITALNNAPFGPPQQSLNGIKVVFTDPRLNDPLWLAQIRFIELAFRDGNDGLFRRIERIPTCEMGSVEQSYLFLNDGAYSVVPSDDLSVATGDTQVLTNFSNIPRICGALAPIAAEDGNLRLSVGATLEGFDCPECMDAEVTADVEVQEDGLVNIRGTVQIFNDPIATDTDMRYPNYVLGGMVIYLAGTGYYAISDNPLDGTGTGEFVITGVPRGRYSLRAASYMCRFDDDLGPRYNLQNGREWQKTSAPVIDMAGAIDFGPDPDYPWEREIDLYGFVGPEFDLDTEVGYGPVIIQNCHNCSVAPDLGLSGTVKMIEMYCMDRDGEFDTLGARTSATSVERTEVAIYRFSQDGNTLFDTVEPFGVRKADFNGYVFSSINLVPPTGNAWKPIVGAWGGGIGLAIQPYRVFTDFGTLTPDADIDGGWHSLFDDDFYNMHDPPSGVEYDSLAVFLGPLDRATQHAFIYNADPAWSLANKATISGRCVDVNGSGVSGALIWMLTNGRSEYTNAVGEFSIRTYGTAGIPGVNRTALQPLFATYPPDISGSFEPVPSQDAVVFDLDGDADGIADEHVTADFVFGFNGGVVWSNRHLKSGGIYKTAVIYEDAGGRSCGLSPLETMRIPFHTADGQYVPRVANFSILSIPPLEAVRYRILRTKDTFYLTFRQAPVGEARYAIIADGASTPSFTTYSNGDATHILLNVPAFTNDQDIPAGTALLMFRGPRTDGYRAKAGDRVRYLLDEEQETVFNDRVLEVDVLGEYLDSETYYVVVPYSEIFREVKKGWTFEFFTPKGFEEEIFYETGVCLPILDPHLPTRRHKGISQDQVIASSTPATGPILSGDTYWWRENFVFSGDFSASLVCEHYHRSQFSVMPCGDIGRAFIFDPGAKRTFFENHIRVSGLYASNSSINDVGMFGVLDFQSLNRTFGAIKFLGMVHNVLLAICQNRVQPVYVGKGRMIDLSGNSIIGRVDQILNVADEVMADGGTLNPESVTIEDGRAYWWDAQHGVFRRYAQNGVDDIGAGRQRYFWERHIERLRLARKDDVVVTGYDRKHDLVFLSFGAATYPLEGLFVPVLEDTLAFSVRDNGWKTHLTWHPECMGAVNDDFVTFKTGRQYRQWRGNQFNFFQNAAHQSTITFVANEGPLTMKDWHSIRVRANKQWFAPSILTPADAEYSNGMSSRLLANNWVQKEGWFHADFLRDALDPHAEFLAIADIPTREATARLRGRLLKGEALIIKLQAVTPNQQNSLLAATVDFSDSQITQ